MELEGIICGERHQEAPAKVVWERIAVVVQKQGVVAQRRHGNTHLGQIVEVLHCGHLDVTEGSDMNNNYEPQKQVCGSPGQKHYFVAYNRVTTFEAL